MLISIEVAIIVVLILINGFLAMSEMAVVSSKKARLKKLVDDGERGADKALTLAEIKKIYDHKPIVVVEGILGLEWLQDLQKLDPAIKVLLKIKHLQI